MYLAVFLILTVIMFAMIYMALNKTSNFSVRIASLIALALMIITIIICVIFVFTDNRVPVDESVLIVGAPVEVKTEKNNNTMALALLVIFLIGVFILITILSMRENRKHIKKKDGAIL